MPQIARAAELAPGTLYLYFPGKSSLYAELLISGYDQFTARLEASLAPHLSPRAQAEALIDAFFAFASDQPELFDIIFFLLQTGARRPRQDVLEPEQLERLVAKENACKAIAGRVLERLHAAPAVPGLVGVDAVWSMLAGVIFLFRGDGPDALAAVAEDAKRVVLAALFGQARPHGVGN